MRIRKLLLTAAEQLTQRGRARLRAVLAAGDPTGEVAAWQGKELLRAVYAAVGMPAARAALERFYRWADGVRVVELSRLARTVKEWEAEILAWHATEGCSNGPAAALHCGVTWQTYQTVRLRGRSARWWCSRFTMAVPLAKRRPASSLRPDRPG